METVATNNSLDVVLFTFSIYGVKGFKSVRAKGADASKRMRSAINQMDIVVRGQLAALTTTMEIDGGASEDVNAWRANERGLLERADSILTSVRAFEKFNFAKLLDPLKAEEDLVEMSTDDFFEIADGVYADNVKLLLQMLDELETGRREKAIEKTSLLADSKDDSIPLGLYVYRATGGIFKDEPFLFTVSPATIAERGNGDSGAAIRQITFETLRLVKNFRLTDYLRTNPNEETKRAVVRADIRALDAWMESVDEISTFFLGDLLSERYTQKTPRSKLDPQSAKAFRLVEVEMIGRLQEYVSKRHRQHDLSEGRRTESQD